MSPSSPWQLFEPLWQWLSSVGYPAGTMHMRPLRLDVPSAFLLLMPLKHAKRKAISSILKAFPERRFVLVGDSVEKDPEIYSKIAARFGDRIERICIRQVEAPPPGRPPQRKGLRSGASVLVVLVSARRRAGPHLRCPCSTLAKTCRCSRRPEPQPAASGL